MDHRIKHPVAAAIVGAAAMLLVLGAAGLVVVYTGAYNVAATEEHTPFVRWAFDTTLHTSVERRAAAVAVPDGVAPEALAAGGTTYKSACQHCHGGPGVERAGWAGGMRPRPPLLADAAAHLEPAEIFWIVKHGLRMTGMPAFAPTHDDAAIWGIAAFVKSLPGLPSDQFQEIGAAPSDHAGPAPAPTDSGG